MLTEISCVDKVLICMYSYFFEMTHYFINNSLELSPFLRNGYNKALIIFLSIACLSNSVFLETFYDPKKIQTQNDFDKK